MTNISDVTSSQLNNYYTQDSTAKTDSTAETKISNTDSKKATTETENNYTNKTALGRYINSNEDNANPRKIFEKLSIDLGGDGKSITKDQLDNYVKKAESGSISLPDEELDALNNLQDEWDNISEGSDSISYSDMSASGNKDILSSMVPDTQDSSTSDLKKAAEEYKTSINNFIKESALSFSANSKSSGTNPYSSMLKTLLTGTTDEADDSNANLIATLTNMIEDSKNTSTIETEA